MTRAGVAILGAGRMGQGIALALHRRGTPVFLVSRTRHPVVPPLRLHSDGRTDAVRRAELILLAVPDAAITPVAAELAGAGVIDSGHVVLHLSGLLDRAALHPLDTSGAALGSIHPLQTVPDPAAAPDRFRGAYAGVEGEDRALQAASALAGSLGMTAVPISPSAKPAYHAGATIAANYTTVLAALAERVAVSAGVAPEVAARLYLPLIAGAAAGLELGPAAALTGPIRRGDAETVAAHLRTLPADARRVYLVLAREALRLASAAGLSAEAGERVARVLDTASGAG